MSRPHFSRNALVVVAVAFGVATACQGADDGASGVGAGSGGVVAGVPSEAGTPNDNPAAGAMSAGGTTSGAAGTDDPGGTTDRGGEIGNGGVLGTGGAAEGGSTDHAGSGAGAGGGDTACPRDPLDASGKTGALLFDAPAPCDAVGKALFLFGERLYWQYESGGKSFLARGSKRGGTAEILVESAEPIGVFDARGAVAYQAGSKAFVLSSSSAEWLELEGAPNCLALTSTSAYVYCRAAEQTVVRWSATGGKSVLFASGLGPGVDLLASPAEDLLLFYSEGRGLWDLPLRPLPPAPPPNIWDRPQPHAPESAHTFRMLPGSEELFWVEPTGMDTSQIVSNRSGVQVEGVQHTVDFAPLTGVGVAFTNTLPDGTTQLALPASSFMTLDYRSSAQVVAMAAEPRRLYWLDSKGRVYHGEPVEPDCGHDDDFTSSFDDRALSDLTAPETQVLCEQLLDYARAPSPDELLHADCIARDESSDLSVSGCEERAGECERSSPWARGLFEIDCLSDVAALSDCTPTVGNYSACIVARNRDIQNLLRTSTCEARARSEAIDALGAGPRECFVLRANCSEPTDP